MGLNSRLVLAVDFLSGSRPKEDGVSALLEEIDDLAVGVKVGLPLALEVGWEGLSRLASRYPEFYWIADLKLADIPAVEIRVLEGLARMGFDAAIIHLFPMGLEEVSSAAAKLGIDLIGVAAMSHPRAHTFEESLETLVAYARQVGVEGLVVGATKPGLIEATRSLHPRATILSPGVGAQGAEPGAAIRAGADFEIVGRAITLSENPRTYAEEVVEAQRRWA